MNERLGTYSRRVKKMVLISIVGWRRPLCEVWLVTRSNFDTPRWSKDIENSRGIQEVYIVNSPHFKHFHSITANLHLNCFSELEDASLFTFFLGTQSLPGEDPFKFVESSASQGGFTCFNLSYNCHHVHP